MKARLTFLAIGLAAAHTAHGQTPAPENRISFSTEHSRLDNGFANWSEQSLQYLRRWDRQRSAGLGLTHTRRFGISDQQLNASHTAALSPLATLTTELTYSPSHRVLARHSAGATLQYEFQPAWLLHTGLRHTRYDHADVTRAALMLEHYVGAFSGSLAWYPVRALGTRASNTEIRATYYYGERNSAGLIASRGDEATQLGAGNVVLAPVRSVALVGQHALGQGLALTWALNHTRQGSFYTRKGVSVGLQYAY